jgi:N-acyl-L-homoserine lactone synthetase
LTTAPKLLSGIFADLSETAAVASGSPGWSPILWSRFARTHEVTDYWCQHVGDDEVSLSPTVRLVWSITRIAYKHGLRVYNALERKWLTGLTLLLAGVDAGNRPDRCGKARGN